ncbi:hypothetical protein M8J76_006767 [Diaphorina citri]|nr:hypothetical protein M8J76_006767 [Diaphorina citri]
MQRKLRFEEVDSSRRLTVCQFNDVHHSESFTTIWRNFCSQQTKPGTKDTKEEDEFNIKYTLKQDDLNRIKQGLSGKPLKVEEIVGHNKKALSEMDKKIKENIEMLKNDLGKMKKTPEIIKYRDMIAKYLPVKISNMEELKSLLNKEFDQFKMSDLNQVPNHIMLLAVAGLVPFLVPCVDVLLISGYTPTMELIQTTYSSLLLTTLGGIHLTSHFRAILHNQVNKEDIPTILYPCTFAWISLLAPSVGLVVNSTGLVLLLLADIQKNQARPSWYKSLRLMTTSTAVVTMVVMVAGKLFS